MKRQWERDLEDPGSHLARLERARAAERAARDATQIACLNISQYVREALDGAVADIELPTHYAFAKFGEETVDGLSDAMRPVFQQLEAAIVARTRPLTTIEHTRLALSVIYEWNRRAALQEERDRRSEWLMDYQAGGHSARVAA